MRQHGQLQDKGSKSDREKKAVANGTEGVVVGGRSESRNRGRDELLSESQVGTWNFQLRYQTPSGNFIELNMYAMEKNKKDTKN